MISKPSYFMFNNQFIQKAQLCFYHFFNLALVELLKASIFEARQI